MLALGASAEQIEQHLGRFNPDDDFYVLEENWPILEWFLQVDDLFRFDGPACIGLDVQAIQADAAMAGRTIKPAHYAGLRQIGRVAAEQLNRKFAKGSK